MKFKIEKHILKKAEELSFITIKHDSEFKVEGYTIPKEGLQVPIKNEVLVKGIKEKTAQDNINAMSIADAMIYIIGIDSQFRYNEEYKKFLNAFKNKVNLDLNAYMGYMSRKYFDIGEYTDSLIYLKALITMSNDDINGLYHYAIVCQEVAKKYQKDNDDKAMNDFLLEALKLGLDEDTTSEVQENIGKMDFKVQYEEGYNLVFQGRNEEGLEKLLPLEEDHSDWWNLLFMIGLAYKNMNEIETAKRYFEKILVIKPHQVDTMVELGLCEASTFNMEKAIEHFETAAKIKEDPEILCNLGMAYLNNGDLDDAVYYIERAYELDPQDEITIACLRELDKYR